MCAKISLLVFRFFSTRLAFNRFLLEKMTERRTNDLCLLNNRCFCVNNLQMLRLVKKFAAAKKNAPKISDKISYQKQQKSLFSVAENVTKCQIKVSGKNRLFLTTFDSRLVSMRLPGCGERKKENDFAVKNDKRAILQY